MDVTKLSHTKFASKILLANTEEALFAFDKILDSWMQWWSMIVSKTAYVRSNIHSSRWYNTLNVEANIGHLQVLSWRRLQQNEVYKST